MEIPETIQAFAILHVGGPTRLFLTAATGTDSCAERSGGRHYLSREQVQNIDDNHCAG
jgi:hypothetical protein